MTEFDYFLQALERIEQKHLARQLDERDFLTLQQLKTDLAEVIASKPPREFLERKSLERLAREMDVFEELIMSAHWIELGEWRNFLGDEELLNRDEDGLLVRPNSGIHPKHTQGSVTPKSVLATIERYRADNPELTKGPQNAFAVLERRLKGDKAITAYRQVHQNYQSSNEDVADSARRSLKRACNLLSLDVNSVKAILS